MSYGGQRYLISPGSLGICEVAICRGGPPPPPGFQGGRGWHDCLGNDWANCGCVVVCLWVPWGMGMWMLWKCAAANHTVTQSA